MQVLARRPFDPVDYQTPTAPGATTGTLTFTGPAQGPDPTELGWKETVRMNPGEVTWVIMRFDLPSVPFTVPASPQDRRPASTSGTATSSSTRSTT